MPRTLLLAIGALVLLSAPRQGNDVFRQVAASTDVGWLEKIGSEFGAAEAITPTHYTPKNVRAAAYVRLGELASDTSLDAAKRIEAAARAWLLLPQTVSLKHMPHPLEHFGDERPEPFAQLRASNGVTNALIGLTRLGGADVFLMTSRTPQNPDSWSRPLLLPAPAPFGIAEPRLKSSGGGDRMIFEFRAPYTMERGVQVAVQPRRRMPGRPDELQIWTVSPTEIRRDQDGDGWTDLEEQRLGTSAIDVDSDDDGIPDGRDPAPRYAPASSEKDDQEIGIFQKVFFAGFGILGSADLLSVVDGSRPFQPWGTRAPIVFELDWTAWAGRFGYGPPMLSWKLISLETDPTGTATATVKFGDSLAGSTATLKRYRGEWFVTNITRNWIS